MRSVEVQKNGQRILSGKVTDGFWSRAVGLLGQSGLAMDKVLYIKPCSDVHTWFMRFSIDIIFLDANGLVLGIKARVPPYRFVFGPKGASGVLETAAGVSLDLGVEVGDNLQLLM